MLESSLFPWLVALTLLVLAIASLEAGYRAGRRTARNDLPDVPHLGAVVGGMLGLMGLLLGFSYAGASSRFLERQQLIVTEANAIGTAYLRADLLPEAHAEALKGVLREYTDSRLHLYKSRSWAEVNAAGDESAALQPKIWATALEGVRAAPQYSMVVLPPVNEVLDLHTTHLSSIRRHLPLLALGALLLISVVSLGIIGFSAGLSKKRNHAVSLALAFLVALTLWITIDMDYPRRGIITLSDRAMTDLRASMKP